MGYKIIQSIRISLEICGQLFFLFVYFWSGFSYNNMGCGVSRPETDGGEGGDLKIISRRGGSTGKNSETAESIILDQEMSTHSKISKTCGEKTSREEEYECKDEEEKGDGRTISLEAPSFRIYCVYPRDPNDDCNLVDDPQRNKCISVENKRGRRQEAVSLKIKRRFNNVRKFLNHPPSATLPSSASSSKCRLRVSD
ncbi:unnamed protein product [Thlaspi arvense]|uniref:Uncharacterized protein n=1 Tax=Thlaspi arvense TaxID=13288 RepID=A0AAU9RKQ6_THLAR|nr:unnamed protein product [Thlaspi arvense]